MKKYFLYLRDKYKIINFLSNGNLMLKGKIKDALKTKYKSMGFSEKAFEAVATHLEGSVTEESEIDTAVEGVEALLKAFQGDVDKRVTDAVAKAKAEKDKADKEKTGDEPDKGKTPENEDVPAWAKGLIDTNKTLLEKVNALEAGKTTETRKMQLEAKLANAPEAVKAKILKDFGRMKFENDEEFGNYLTETDEDLKGFESFGTQGADKSPVPVLGGKNTKTGISTDTQAYIEARKAETEGKVSTAGKQIFQS